MLFGLLPFAISQIYSSTLRETKDTFIPMISSIIAILVNLVLNYTLIYGNFGFKAYGITGAAIATVISRFIEMGFLIIYTHLHPIKYSFIKGIYKSLKIPSELVGRITYKGFPLLMNELVWSLGMTTLFKIYSERGFFVVAAFNISSTTNNLFTISFLALANAIAIIIGQLLGAGKLEEAKDSSRKILFFTVLFSTFAGLLLVSISFFVPNFYNTEASVKALATNFMIVGGLCFPIYAFNCGCYFNLRAGGVTVITFLFDSLFVLVVSIPIAFLLIRFTTLSILLVYLIVQLSEIIKSLIGFSLVKNGVWIKNLVEVNL
jgi:Na+-driven multidrug efflux pump